MQGHLLIVHGGGPTAVINASLYGVIVQARKHPEISRIYAARGGMGGVLREQLMDLTELPDEKLEGLLHTPGSAIGTSREPLDKQDYARIAEILRRHGVRYVLLNGGNGTMDTCGKLYEQLQGTDIRVIGIPKTMDNDLAMTDHAPGFGSAARYMAQSVAEVAADLKSLPIHVIVIEALGRNAGWVTAASALAKTAGVDGPDLIYVPERPFDEEAFLRDVQALIDRKRGAIVVASEGLTDAQGKPIVEPVFQVGRATYFGDVSAHLAQLVTKKLGYKARSEKPGLLGRASMAMVSRTDRQEAQLVGEEAVKAVLRGESGKMVGLVRESTSPYRIRTELFDVQGAMLVEHRLPDEYINDAGNGVTQAFVDWCLPLIGGPIPQLTTLD